MCHWLKRKAQAVNEPNLHPLRTRKFESAPGLRQGHSAINHADGPSRFRELPGQPASGDVLVIRSPSVPPIPATKPAASPSPPTVGQRTHGCHNRPPLATTIDVQDGWHGGKRVMDTLPTKWEQRCVYSSNAPSDVQCVGCRWQSGASDKLASLASRELAAPQ